MIPLPAHLLALLLALAPAAQPAPVPQAARESLERLLERQREARAAELSRLEFEVRAFLDAFARLAPPLPPEREAELATQLRGLGPAAGVLLVPYLEPGHEAQDVLRLRARAVAQALSGMCDATVTDPLLALLAVGSAEARLNALRALEGCSEPARARPALTALFESDPGPLRAAVLRTLLAMGGPGNDEVFARALAGEDAGLRQLALGALIQSQSPVAETHVRALLRRPAAAVGHIPQLLAYYRALPGQVDAEVVGLWVALVTRTSKSDDKLAILAALPDLGQDSGSALKKALEPLTESGDLAVVEGARIALSRLGDRNARRDVLRRYDDFIEKNDRWSQAYSNRAQVLMRMHEWDEAIKDFTTALRFGRDDGQPLDEAYLGLARACAKRGKLKDAAEWLRKAPIPMKELRALADDPDFRELRESRFGKDVWGD